MYLCICSVQWTIGAWTPNVRNNFLKGATLKSLEYMEQFGQQYVEQLVYIFHIAKVESVQPSDCGLSYT